MIKGQVIGGELGRVIIRQKSSENMEIGEILKTDALKHKTLLQVYELTYASQISQTNLEMISGLKLETDADIELFDGNIRNYTVAYAKPLAIISDKNVQMCKMLPAFFSHVSSVDENDLKFMTTPHKPLFLGNLRSGSKMLDVPVNIPGDLALSHHILISATTGKGKSNLVKSMLWSIVSQDYCGIIVLDPHDEYYGRNGVGIKDHPALNKVSYYTSKDAPNGTRTLKINIKLLKPDHFKGAIHLTDAQTQAMNAFYKEYGNRWIESIILEKTLKVDFHEATVAVLKRRFIQLLDLEFDSDRVFCRGIFDLLSGETTIKDISSEAESGKTVIIDTSSFSGSLEILIGSMIASEILNRYRGYKTKGLLETKPVISIVIEEAPRVLGKDALESGQNIFSTIAREGRKFKIGLCAITQLPSLIPREILANMNTKIILGTEMKPERQAIIESASQDLSSDDRNIASLDKGEALITSTFVRFATPIKAPLFEDIVKTSKSKIKNQKLNNSFQGIKI